MASFDELRATLAATFALDSDDGDSFSLTLPLADGHTERAQRVVLQRYASWGQELLEVRSAFGEAQPGEADELLEQNLRLPIGAVALHGRYLVLVQRLPLEYVSFDAVLFVLTRVAEVADVLEERRGGDRF
jgi:hypothetical protein